MDRIIEDLIKSGFIEITCFDLSPGYYINNKGDIFTTRINNAPPRLMRLGIDSEGYKTKKLVCKDGKRHTFRVHRLVAMMFIGNPNNLPIVMHLDNNKGNNYYKNLKWGTIQENTQSAYNDCLTNFQVTFAITYIDGTTEYYRSKQEFMRLNNIRPGYVGQLLERIQRGNYSGKYSKFHGATVKFN